ncbi:hypothetical protein M4S82_01790 [Planococcus sp. MERTA32b]|nr:hypothetical protein [Planococcus sp. MER TA 32b]
MEANIILGRNMDTSYWILELKKSGASNINVLDYEYFGDPIQIDDVFYLSSHDLMEKIKSYDSRIYYKSLYIFPTLKKYNTTNSK